MTKIKQGSRGTHRLRADGRYCVDERAQRRLLGSVRDVVIGNGAKLRQRQVRPQKVGVPLHAREVPLVAALDILVQIRDASIQDCNDGAAGAKRGEGRRGRQRRIAREGRTRSRGSPSRGLGGGGGGGRFFSSGRPPFLPSFLPLPSAGALSFSSAGIGSLERWSKWRHSHCNLPGGLVVRF